MINEALTNNKCGVCKRWNAKSRWRRVNVFSVHRVAAHLLARSSRHNWGAQRHGGRKQTTQDSGGATATTKQTHERTQRIHLNILTISDISTCSTLTINVMSTDEGLTTNRQATVARTHSHAHALTHAHRLSADHRPSTHIIEIYLSQHRANNLAATRIVIEKVERIRQRFFINTNIDKFILRLKCNY